MNQTVRISCRSGGAAVVCYTGTRVWVEGIGNGSIGYRHKGRSVLTWYCVRTVEG